MGEHLRKARLDRGLYQREAAEQIGVHTQTIKNWELGHTTPARRHLPALVAFLGFVPFDLGDTWAERVGAWRIIHGLTRDELAARLGVDESTVWRWEAGESCPAHKHRERLEELFVSSEES